MADFVKNSELVWKAIYAKRSEATLENNNLPQIVS